MDSLEIMKALDIDSKIENKLNKGSKYTPKTPKSGR